MTDRELMQQALDALEQSRVFVTTREKIKHPEGTEWYDECVEALRARLAQPDCACDSPAWCKQYNKCHRAVVGLEPYAAPPQREWQTLTENEIKHLWYEACQTNLELTSQLIVHLARNIEAKLKEKNT